MYTRLLIAVSLVTACEVNDSGGVAAACNTICACEEVPLPAVQERCIAECVQEVEDIPDQCLACISSHTTCATLERDCEPLCNPPEPVFGESR